MGNRRQQYCAAIRQHYAGVWGALPSEAHWRTGPVEQLPAMFSVARFPPRPDRSVWTYATIGMSDEQDPHPIELHLFSPHEDESLVELLTVVAHYHRTGAALQLADSVNFGRPWLKDSPCDHGLLSLPYLDGPKLEWMPRDHQAVQFLWLIPITKAEVEFKKQYGLEALEAKFEERNFDYANPRRPSVLE